MSYKKMQTEKNEGNANHVKNISVVPIAPNRKSDKLHFPWLLRIDFEIVRISQYLFREL